MAAAAPAPSSFRPPVADERPLVTLKKVSKAFSNGTLALSGLSLSVRSGEFISLLGPSGCGKSTALRIIAGLGGIDSGSVGWPSFRLNAKGRPEGGIGYVFQEPTLLPWRTVLGNVYLPLRLQGLTRKKARERIMETLAMVGLADFAAAHPRELSGGMKMRVSIARALVTSPKLLLMDEPFGALDEITRQKLNDDVLRLWQEHGITVVFVTHSVFESAYLSSRVVVMRANPGRVYADLSLPAGLKRDPNFRTTEAFRETCESISLALFQAMGGEESR
jgi:NitT/TauT family transport system ATP-binding protein